MEKKLITLACAITAVVVTVIICWFVTQISSSIGIPISEIVSNPEAWVNKKVRVNGTMIGPLISIPEVKPPYNYWLQDRDNKTISIGVRYSGELPENSPYVTVVGTVKAGYTEGLMGGNLVYYIEVEKIVFLEPD